MIRFPEMFCYDIHTHSPAIHPKDVSILNIIVREKLNAPAAAQWQSCGIHPWYIDGNVQEQLAQLRSLALLPQTVAIGEAGFDKLATSPLALQEKTFLEQAFLAEEINKPLIIHCVKAWDELIASFKSIKPHVPWIIHGFRGNEILAEQLVRQGFYLSFGSYFNPSALSVAWPERIFAETDEKGSDIHSIYQQIANSLQLSVENLALTLTNNVLQVFPSIYRKE